VSRRFWQGLLALSLFGTAGVGLAAGCGEDQSLVGGTCATDYAQCGNQCVDLESNSENCGACNLACPAGVECSGGVCGGVDGAAADGADTGTDGAMGEAEGAASDAPAGGQTDAPISDGPAADMLVSADSNGDAPANDAPASDAPANDVATADGAQANDGTTPGAADGAPGGGDDTAEEPLCQLPLVDCSGACVDTTMDALNCGGCGTSCYSGICQMSHCVGETTGAIVLIGHDYTSYSPAQARLLSNAVLLPQSSQTLPVLSYERYASTTDLTNIKSIIGTAATNVGRTLALSPTMMDSDVTTGLTIDKYGVLLVADQAAAAPGVLATLGASWMTALAAFTQAGGVVVILDGGTGVKEMPQFVTATGLLSVSAQASVPLFTQVNVIAPTDAIAVGVGNRYAAGNYSVSFTTEPAAGNVVYVVAAPSEDGATGSPMVVHKVF
jgi:hypothetical protein